VSGRIQQLLNQGEYAPQVVLDAARGNALHEHAEALSFMEGDMAEGENHAFLPYNQIYKAVLTKQGLYIYSSRVNAYIIPRRDIEGCVEDVCGILRKKLQSYQLNF
jgi:hypothetical protein